MISADATPYVDQVSDDPRYYHDIYLELRTALFHFGKFPNDLDDQERGKLAAEVIKQRTINHAVESSEEYTNVIVPEEEVEIALKEIYDQVSEDMDVHSVLESHDLDGNTLRQAIRIDLRVAVTLDYVAQQADGVNDVDAELFYHLHQDRFATPELRHVRHILITVNDEYKENTRNKALEKIEGIRKDIVERPARFGELAHKHSECPTALHEGQMGTVTEGQLYPELNEVLFSMNEGEISEVVESQLGFHVLKCDKIEYSELKPFSEVKEKIIAALVKRNQRTYQRRWLQSRLASMQK